MSVVNLLHHELADRLRKLYVNVLLFYIGAVLHLYWGLSLLIKPEATHTTGLEPIAQLFGSFEATGFVLLGVSLLSFYAILTNGRIRSFFMLLPQQILLILSALGVIYCVIHGRFADGDLHPAVFILRDQAPLLAIALGHSISMSGFGLYLMIKARCRA